MGTSFRRTAAVVRRLGAATASALPGLILPVAILLVWEVSSRRGLLPPTLIAPPTEVAARLGERVSDLSLFMHTFASLRRLLPGFLIGISLGIAFGTLVGVSRLGARLLEPTVLTLIPIPPMAWIPLLIILLGIDDASKIALISVASFCVLFIHTAYGIRTTDQSLVEVARVLGKGRLSTLVHILLPSALPSILSSMRLALAASWTLLIASEVIASSKGLGWLIWDSRNFSRPADMIVGMIAVGILGKTSDSLLVALERYLMRWRATYRDLSDA